MCALGASIGVYGVESDTCEKSVAEAENCS